MPARDGKQLFHIYFTSINFHLFLACVESVSVRFRSKERETRVKDRAKNGASKRAGRGWGRKLRKHPPPSRSFIFWLSFRFLRGQNRKFRSSVFLCSETKGKRLLLRLTCFKNTVNNHYLTEGTQRITACITSLAREH